MTVPTPTIDVSGITLPTYSDIYSALSQAIDAIFGSDTYQDPDSQDGQLVGVFAQALKDTSDSVGAAYNSFSPATAQGTGLSNNVKINGLRRLIPSNSTATVTLTGVNGTQIINGQIGDNQGLSTVWNLPPTVTIGISGSVDVTATSADPGAITALAATLTQILTPTRNWQSVTNTLAAVPGDPTEDDATLRQRQSASTAQPAQTPFDAIVAEVGNVAGVQRFIGYENDTDATDGNGLPPHSISIVVEGGDVNAVGSAIALKKTPGTATYGTTTVTVVDPAGISKVTNFFELTVVPIYYEIDVTALAGFVTSTTTLIQQAVAQWTNDLNIGDDVVQSKVYGPANLYGDAAVVATGLTQAQLDVISKTYKVTAIKLGIAPAPAGTADIVIAFNAAASGSTANISVPVT